MTEQALGEVREVNGVSVDEILEAREEVRRNPALAERNRTLVATWVGQYRSRVEVGGASTHIGGEGELGAMSVVLGALAACEVDVIVTEAALMGLEIADLRVEVTGHYNAARYLGLEDGPGPGYDRFSYVARMRAPGATAEQVARLRERCERCSPVGDTLARGSPIRVNLDVDASPRGEGAT